MASKDAGYVAELLKGIGIDSDDAFLQVSFDSSQFGVLNEATGEFLLMGQN